MVGRFRKVEVEQWAREDLGPGTTVNTDGLGSCHGLEAAGCEHKPRVTGSAATPPRDPHVRHLARAAAPASPGAGRFTPRGLPAHRQCRMTAKRLPMRPLAIAPASLQDSSCPTYYFPLPDGPAPATKTDDPTPTRLLHLELTWTVEWRS